MVCLGVGNTKTTANQESTVAQFRALELFRKSFLSRHPGGIVISELEYRGGTTNPFSISGGIRYKNREQDRVIQALASDFRNHNSPYDSRKPDGLGLSYDGLTGELLEVTTSGNRASAERQIQKKLDILINTVNRINNLRTDWYATSWRPAGNHLFYQVPPQNGELSRYICYQPTIRDSASKGTVLYEIHAIGRAENQASPSAIPQGAKEDLKIAYKRSKLQPHTINAWARHFLDTHPEFRGFLRNLVYLMGVTAAIVAVVLIFDPVPGDEVMAANAAAALISLSTGMR